MNILRLSIPFLFVATISSAQIIPTEKAKALDDSEVVLPDPGSQRVLILVLGFSHKSADLIEDWGKHLAADFHDNAHVAYYQIPDLLGVPGLVKPMILHGMRKDIPEAEYSHFVPIYDHKQGWQSLVNFSAPDDAYVLVASPAGHPISQAHGPFSDETYNELKKPVSSLL
jgi:hypothetical protein